MVELPEASLLDEVAHSLIVAGVIIAGLTGLLAFGRSLTEYQTSAEVAVIGLWMWAIGVIILCNGHHSAYSNLTPS